LILNKRRQTARECAYDERDKISIHIIKTLRFPSIDKSFVAKFVEIKKGVKRDMAFGISLFQAVFI
jgi:hypothetical protein